MVEDLPQRRVVYSIPGMQDVTVHSDVTYRYSGGNELLMDVYLPPGLTAGAREPVVLFVHGGPIRSDLCPQPKDWGQYLSYGRLLAASGLVAVTFNHRLWSRDDLGTPESDVANAISYIRENANAYGVDPDRVCIWGFSGGGPLLSFVLRERPAFVRCMVAYYTLMDLRAVPGDVKYDPAIVERFSPTTYLDTELPSDLALFVARAGQDRRPLNEAIDCFITRALQANAFLEVANHPRGRHAFDLLDGDKRSRDIIARTIDFVVKHA